MKWASQVSSASLLQAGVGETDQKSSHCLYEALLTCVGGGTFLYYPGFLRRVDRDAA